MQQISDMQNYILSRWEKGKTPEEARQDLVTAGYDLHSAHGLVMLYWPFEENNGT